MTDRTSSVGVVGTERARCVLVRHGESTWNAEHRWAGQADPPLTDNGRAAAFRLAKTVATEGFAVVASSPLQRALETANIIAKMAVGIADDALSTYAVAHRQQIAIAPAMNWSMLQHPTVVQNLARKTRRPRSRQGPATIVVAHQGVIRVAEAELGAHATEVDGLSLWWLEPS